MLHHCQKGGVLLTSELTLEFRWDINSNSEVNSTPPLTQNMDQPITRPLIYNIDENISKAVADSEIYDPGSRILMDSTNFGSQATNNSTFQNANFSNNDSGDKTYGDGQDISLNSIMVKASKNSPPSVHFSIFDKNIKSFNPIQGVKRQRKASASQRQSNTIDKYLVNHK